MKKYIVLYYYTCFSKILPADITVLKYKINANNEAEAMHTFECVKAVYKGMFKVITAIEISK